MIKIFNMRKFKIFVFTFFYFFSSIFLNNSAVFCFEKNGTVNLEIQFLSEDNCSIQEVIEHNNEAGDCHETSNEELCFDDSSCVDCRDVSTQKLFITSNFSLLETVTPYLYSYVFADAYFQISENNNRLLSFFKTTKENRKELIKVQLLL